MSELFLLVVFGDRLTAVAGDELMATALAFKQVRVPDLVRLPTLGVRCAGECPILNGHALDPHEPSLLRSVEALAFEASGLGHDGLRWLN
jgi:hypothetical protein